MTNFSTDADLLKWEPALMREIALDHQCLVQGTGAVSQGLSVTASSATFVTAHVRPGHVIHLRSDEHGVDGYYEVISVETETQLLAGLIGAGGQDPVPLPASTALEFSIHTFDPQHEEAHYALLARFGLETDMQDAVADLERWISRRRALRRASVALVLATLYRGQATGGPEADGLTRKAEHYTQLYEDEVSKARVALDRDGDGRPDDVRAPASFRLRRD